MQTSWLVKAGIPLILSTTALITIKLLVKNRASSSSVLEDLKRREHALEKRFFAYQDMKEREAMAMEIRNKLYLEMNQLEFLAKEAALMEAEATRMEEVMVEYYRVVKRVESLGFEKSLVEKKVRKLRRRVMDKCRVVREYGMCIKVRDEEILRKNEEIVKMEDEIGLVRSVVDQLKEERVELLNKIEILERSAASTKSMINDEDVVTKEAYDKVMEELENKAKDQTTMENELIHLKWSNACLKHELKSCQEQIQNLQQDINKKSHLDLDPSPKVVTLQQLFHEVEYEGSPISPLVHDNEGSCLTQDEKFSKRKRLVKKLRKWVEKGKNEEMNKCLRRNSIAHSEDAYESFDHHRDSFSSV